MSKNTNKATPNPNRPRSRNNPNGKRNDPPIDWPVCNEGRRSGGQRHAKRMPMVADKAREIMCIVMAIKFAIKPTIHMRILSTIVANAMAQPNRPA